MKRIVERHPFRTKWLTVVAASLDLMMPRTAGAQDAASFYSHNCLACHTIGGKRTLGPDLKDVTQRKDRAWLLRFLADPKGVVDSGDPYAQQIVKESHGFVMPQIKGMDRALTESLLNYIDSQSKSAGSTASVGKSAVALHAFTTADMAQGKEIVLGAQPLANGGPACIACHTLSDLGSLGGGRLGPDLSDTFEKMGGREGLTAWLASPATPVMQSIFKTRPLKQEELLPVVAYLGSVSKPKENANGSSSERLNFFLMGLGGSMIGLVVLDGLWRNRFNAVRRPLVDGKRG